MRDCIDEEYKMIINAPEVDCEKLLPQQKEHWFNYIKDSPTQVAIQLWKMLKQDPKQYSKFSETIVNMKLKLNK